MATDRQSIGSRGETLVADWLARRGFQIVARNVHAGGAELDIIAENHSVVVFCEVRARSTRAFLDPIQTIDRAKVGRVRRAAAAWLATHPTSRQVRFDAASVCFDSEPPRIEYYEAAF